MKHSKKENKPRSQKGFSKGKANDLKRLGPIMIEDVMKESVPFVKNDVTVREMMIRTDPTDVSSPVIKKRFKPLDNPLQVLEVLQGILIIKEGVIGNNVTTGPLQYSYWRGCLEGTALRKFNEFATAVGTETSAHLSTVENRLVSFFAPREVLSQQHRYFRHYMRKPFDTTTRQYVGAVHTLNETFEKLPPAFNAAQKIPPRDVMDILVSKAPKKHKELLTDQGFDPHTATTAEYVEICERAETKENLRNGSKHARFEDSADDSSSDERHKQKKSKKKSKKTTDRTPFFCKLHGPNTTHDSVKCKVLLARKAEKQSDWKKKDSADGNKYNQAKYKKKQRELNFLQEQTKKEKAKWMKAYKKLKSAPKTEREDEASEGEVSVRSKTVRSFSPRKQYSDNTDNSDESSSSSSSSSSASSNTESE